MDTVISNLQHSMTDLQLKITSLSHQVELLEATPNSSPIHAITASTSNHRHSQTSKSSTLTVSTKDTWHKRKNDINTDRGNEWGTNNTWGSRKRSYLILHHRPPLHKLGNRQSMTRPSLRNHDIAHHHWRFSHQPTSQHWTSCTGVIKYWQVVNAYQPGTVSAF